MDLDPHTLQQILQRIYQQMRCPQCGKRVPVDFSSVQVVAQNTMLLQLKCEGCNAYIVLHASLQGVEKLGMKEYEVDLTANTSSTLQVSDRDVAQLRNALKKAGGSFQDFFEEPQEGPQKKNDVSAA